MDHPRRTEAPLLRVQLLRAGAAAPQRQSAGAAGLDLAACLPNDQPVEIAPGDIRTIPCGFAMAIPPGFEGQVRPRSGLASQHGITLPNSPGTIDADYRGEVMVPLINLGKATFFVTPGLRIAQLVIAPIAIPEVELCQELDATTRGTGGFGSTGER